MNISEFDTDSFMAGWQARDLEVQRTVKKARKGRRNIVKALQEDRLGDFRHQTLRAEVAAKSAILNRKWRQIWGKKS